MVTIMYLMLLTAIHMYINESFLLWTKQIRRVHF